MLPLGAVGLALVVGLPCWALWAAERYRKSHKFLLRDGGDHGPTSVAALVALGKWAWQIQLPLNYRVTFSRDRRGMTPVNMRADMRYDAIRKVLRAQAEKENR